MALLLFSLRHVPDDEADDVRDLLAENHISVYETHAGNWGISMPAIWLADEQQLEQACTLINVYQEERRKVQQENYARLQQSGEVNTFFKNFWHNPVQTVVFITAMLAILYLSFKLVMDMGL